MATKIVERKTYSLELYGFGVLAILSLIIQSWIFYLMILCWGYVTMHLLREEYLKIAPDKKLQ